MQDQGISGPGPSTRSPVSLGTRSGKASHDGVSEPHIAVTKRPSDQRDRSASHDEIVTREWTVAEIVNHYPQTTEVMAEYGLHCFGCSVSAIETLEEGCAGHGFSEDDIDNLVYDINDAIANIPSRPQTLTITKEAAEGIREISEKEETKGQGLSVQANKDGSFFMEFRETMEEGESEFVNEEVSDVRIWASPLTLQRIGGATIMLKERKFTLEASEGCCGEVQCDCRGAKL
jgi:hybrid cluster-associated redox disulfide protein